MQTFLRIGERGNPNILQSYLTSSPGKVAQFLDIPIKICAWICSQIFFIYLFLYIHTCICVMSIDLTSLISPNCCIIIIILQFNTWKRQLSTGYFIFCLIFKSAVHQLILWEAIITLYYSRLSLNLLHWVLPLLQDGKV